MTKRKRTHLYMCAGLIWVTLASYSEALGGAVIEGAVDLGDPPRRPRAVERYGAGGAEPAAPPARPPAVVYLEGPFDSSGAPSAGEMPQMLQKNLQFEPVVLPVQVGTTVAFPNEDAVYHNVFSYASSKSFDLGRYQGTEGAPTVTFDAPGVVSVFCEIHSHMRSVILVLDSPYFVVTDAKGVFRLEDLPTGKFVLKAWVNEKTVYAREVTLEDGDTLKVNFAKP